jgi:hypothetical protein
MMSNKQVATTTTPPETVLLLFDGKIETFNEIKFKVILWALHEILEIMLLQVILNYTGQSFGSHICPQPPG